MPLYIDRTSEVSISTLFDTEFIRGLKKYLGFHPDTASDDMPVSIEDLFHEAISTCETEQWRFILPKDVVLELPKEAFCYSDKLLILPFGPLVEPTSSGAEGITISYKDVDSNSVPFTDFEQYLGEPIRLYSETWDTMINACKDMLYPISVSYSAGYSEFSEIPKSTIRALKILTYHYFEFRDSMLAGNVSPVPEGFEHNRNHAVLNDHRGIKYIVDDWCKVSA